MAYRATSRGLGLTNGYSLMGGCDASGNLTGGTATGGLVQYPDGSQHCLQYSDPAWININYNRPPDDKSGAPYIVPLATSPQQQVPSGPGILPPSNIPPLSPAASSSLIDSALTWVKTNPLYAAGIAVGAFLLLRGMK